MKTRIALLFLALLTLMASSSYAGCKFQPSELARRIIEDKDRYQEMRKFADTTQSDRQAKVFSQNERIYPYSGKVNSTADKVTLKLLTSPAGQVLDAKITNKGKQKQSNCLAYEWASDNQFISPIIGGQSMSCWTQVEVTINYGTYDKARVRVVSARREAAERTQTTTDAPVRDRRVVAENIGEYTDLPASDQFVAVEVLAEMIHQVPPEYPESEKEAGHEGAVWIKALVGKDGSVLEATAFKSSGYPLLDDAALDVALENKFKPATKDGEPVAMWVTYKVNFVKDN